MATATGAMTKMQQQINPAKVNQTMQQFAKENAKMEMTQEMVGDTLDNALDDETTEDETGELVNQVSLAKSLRQQLAFCFCLSCFPVGRECCSWVPEGDIKYLHNKSVVTVPIGYHTSGSVAAPYQPSGTVAPFGTTIPAPAHCLNDTVLPCMCRSLMRLVLTCQQH